MSNLESSQPEIESNEPIQSQEHLNIPIESVLSIQLSLMHKMVPDETLPFFVKSDGQNIGIEDDLFMKWQEKYSAKFRLYCDSLNPDTDREIIEKIQNGTLDTVDFEVIQAFLEK